MKKILLTASLLFAGVLAFGQNMNDHKVSFKYIQLPYIKVDPKFSTYELRVEHDYLAANDDSTAMHEIRKSAAMSVFQSMLATYQTQRDSLDRVYLRSLSAWEKQVNAGATNPDGTALTKPNPPMYPEPPAYPNVEAPRLHTDFDASTIGQSVQVAGFEEGVGGIIITMSIQPIQHFPITQTVKGTGASKKYQYNAPYILPIGIKVESPTQGVLLEETLFQGKKNYKMKDQKSQYDHQLYMMDNDSILYREIESFARRNAINSVRDYLNNKIGFVEKSRTAEIYSVKKFKDYDYSDVTNAYTILNQGLQYVKNDRDRSGAADKLEEALAAFEEILQESNLSDKKARINDKITAMMQCNIAEIQVWLGEFDDADAIGNLAMNSGEGKAKRHMRDEQGFYADQRKRWEANY
jgi:hypothetical protein